MIAPPPPSPPARVLPPHVSAPRPSAGTAPAHQWPCSGHPAAPGHRRRQFNTEISLLHPARLLVRRRRGVARHARPPAASHALFSASRSAKCAAGVAQPRCSARDAGPAINKPSRGRPRRIVRHPLAGSDPLAQHRAMSTTAGAADHDEPPQRSNLVAGRSTSGAFHAVVTPIRSFSLPTPTPGTAADRDQVVGTADECSEAQLRHRPQAAPPKSLLWLHRIMIARDQAALVFSLTRTVSPDHPFPLPASRFGSAPSSAPDPAAGDLGVVPGISRSRATADRSVSFHLRLCFVDRRTSMKSARSQLHRQQWR